MWLLLLAWCIKWNKSEDYYLYVLVCCLQILKQQVRIMDIMEKGNDFAKYITDKDFDQLP